MRFCLNKTSIHVCLIVSFSLLVSGCNGLRKRSFEQISEDVITDVILQDIEKSGKLFPDDYFNHSLEPSLLDYNPKHQKAWLENAVELHNELLQVDGFEPDYQELSFYLERIVSLDSNELYQYPISPFFGPHLDTPNFLTSIPLASRNQIEHYIELLTEVENQFGGLIDALEFQRKRGLILPTFLLDEVIHQCDSITLQSSEENILYTHCKNQLDKIGILEPTIKQQYLVQVATALSQSVYPAYVRLANYLRQLERHSTSVAGLWQYEVGNSRYQNLVHLNAGANVSVDTLNLIGRLELNRLQGEILILENLVQNVEISAIDTLRFPNVSFVKRVVSSSQLEEGYKLFFSKYTGNLSPEKHLSNLKNQRLAILALLVDIGIHHKRWLREQGIDFVLKNCDLTKTEAQLLTDKSISKPGYSVVTAVTFLRLCELYEDGEIDLARFYQKVTDRGYVPVVLLN